MLFELSGDTLVIIITNIGFLEYAIAYHIILLYINLHKKANHFKKS